MSDNSDVFDAEYFTEPSEPAGLPATVEPATPAVSHPGMVQAHTQFFTALQVQKPRDLAAFRRNVLAGAETLGREAFYAWGSGKNHVEGATIHLANLMLAQYGNAMVRAEPIQETAEAWYFTHHFVDLEGQTSQPRQLIQSKREDVGMRTDPVRANQIRFNRGQSKAIRNCILNAMPRTLVLRAIEAAKRGVSARMERFINEKGLAAAQRYTLEQLARVGVPEDAVLRKLGKEKTPELDANDLRRPAPAADLKDKLRAAAAPSGSSLTVVLGKEPSTYIVAEGALERLVTDDGVGLACNCGAKRGPCPHVLAVERYRKQA